MLDIELPSLPWLHAMRWRRHQSHGYGLFHIVSKDCVARRRYPEASLLVSAGESHPGPSFSRLVRCLPALRRLLPLRCADDGGVCAGLAASCMVLDASSGEPPVFSDYSYASCYKAISRRCASVRAQNHRLIAASSSSSGSIGSSSGILILWSAPKLSSSA